ncbi:uncharacterized protein LDX57_002357 [Aspergillus melleus]|uniref:uncharacterized protein n=1 Tax=Aspergillus melleus TaxID=138277 RepID=UPI001E8CA311|nr:uncharacterized protein LDX57_002357 [Aspergillus melleus]KAH8424613.1 hypothetical protein LDX57_002357 [Aspergillus melleus]
MTPSSFIPSTYVQLHAHNYTPNSASPSVHPESLRAKTMQNPYDIYTKHAHASASAPTEQLNPTQLRPPLKPCVSSRLGPDQVPFQLQPGTTTSMPKPLIYFRRCSRAVTHRFCC